MVKVADLLVIDAIFMGHRYIFECIDRSLKDIRGNEKPFGGMTVLLAGDEANSSCSQAWWKGPDC